jgi:glycosyltransferase involved in cell wall biosynthesis
LRSVQNQFFNDIEFIFVDDFSKDNTTEIIKNLQKFDERIILIKNNRNKGTLIS